MDGRANAAEQIEYAQRLTRAGERLRQRAAGMNTAIVEGEVLADVAVIVPIRTGESAGKCEPGS
jgi:hypothetical protein